MKGQNLHKAKLEPYRPPVWLRNGHIQSVWPTLFRKVTLPEPETDGYTLFQVLREFMQRAEVF